MMDSLGAFDATDPFSSSLGKKPSSSRMPKPIDRVNPFPANVARVTSRDR